MDGERAGIHVADRVDQAHHPPGAAHVQAGQRAGFAEPDKWKKESPVSTRSPLATSQW